MTLMRILCTAVVAATLASVAGCSAKSVMVKRPTNDTVVDHQISETWAREIKRTARDGDWILTRSYGLMADGILVVTGLNDSSLSHASIYSAERGTVIEAIDSGVREIPLVDLLQRNHYAVVVRPTGMSAAEQRLALDWARAQVGASYDISGLVGINRGDQFYCSELVWWASDGDARYGRERVITPNEMLGHGEVIYWSGTRDIMLPTATPAARIAGR